MKEAFCLSDERTYDAETFSALPPAKLAVMRRELICIKCKAQAFFRKASVSARDACFGARPHNGDCLPLTTDGGTWGADGEEPEDAWVNDATRIVIDIDWRGTESDQRQHPKVGDRASGEGRKFGGTGIRTNSAKHHRLRPILRRLITDSTFSVSAIQITPPEGPATYAGDFFVPFDRALERAQGMFRGLWGMITDATLKKNGPLWLNTGGRDGISFVIDTEDVPAFVAAYKLNDVQEELSGAQALILCIPRISGSGKLYARLGEPGYMALIPASRI